MNDEKKLNDEAVENVAGGEFEYIPTQEQLKQLVFDKFNCLACDKRNCPYGGNNFLAFRELGGEPCPDYTGLRNIQHPHADKRR